MQNDKNFRPDRIGAYFRIEWLPLALVTVSGLIYNIGLLATPWFEGRLAQCLADILDGSATAAAMAILVLTYVLVTLVVQAARQCAIDRYRALLRRGETLPLDDRDDAELAVALESELETRELMAQVMALPPPDGELFLRRYVYGETAAQLGVHFNMPAATVRTRLHRARLALQKLLKEG